MRMEDDKKSPRGRVSILREQLQEKLNACVQKDLSHLVSSNAVLTYPVPCEALRPAVPLHRSKSPSQALTSHIKPPVAPKPPKISTQKPAIFVSGVGGIQKNSPHVTNLKPFDSTPKIALADKDLHEDVNSCNERPSRDIPRPQSIASTTSTENGDTAEISDSESEDGRRNSTALHREISYLAVPHRFSQRRPSALCFNGDPSIHEKIVDELKRQGIIRSGDCSYKKAEASHDLGSGEKQEEYLQPVAAVAPNGVSTAGASIYTATSNGRVASVISNRSSTYTATSNDYESVPNYCTGDADEDRRLKKLHFAATEFYSVQKLFLKYLRDMGEIYPEYVTEYGKRIGKDLLARQGSQLHVVRQLQLHFEQLIRVHQLLLEEFSSRLDVWNSLEPNMAEVMVNYADFLKICKPFLLEKSRFVQELTQLRIENKDFDNATVAFEQKIFNRGVGAVVQQLDQVHQNFMRYKILMMSYNNYLEIGSEEQKKTLEAITKLEKIAQSVNESMGLPSNEELFKLYDRFQCHFDVFYPGRRLIRQGEVLKQTRKEPQPRYLVLFSDVLWICRVMSGFGSSGLFDMGRSYGIPIETVRTESNPHEDYEQQLYVKSKYKSLILIMSSARERSQWQKEIDDAREEKRKYKRRMSEAIERQRRQSLNPLVREPLSSEDVSAVDQCQFDTCDSILPPITCDSTDGEMTRNDLHLVMLRRNSESQDSSSHTSTPIDDTPGTSSSSSLTVKKKVLRADTMKPLWIPDDSSTKCLMDGCDTVFSLLNRRHHCRNCGWLICSDCVGKAPLSKFQFKKEIVCPECYDALEGQYSAGTLFPVNILVRGSDGLLRVRVLKSGGLHDKKFSLVEPHTLFLPPINRRLKRMNVKERMLQNNGLVFGKVIMKTAKGGEVMRHAELADGMVLKFYKAPFDHEPYEQYVIYGFELRETELESGGTQFELIHHNQIRTDRKEHVISFRVEHEKSINKWSTALRQGLGIE